MAHEQGQTTKEREIQLTGLKDKGIGNLDVSRVADGLDPINIADQRTKRQGHGGANLVEVAESEIEIGLSGHFRQLLLSVRREGGREGCMLFLALLVNRR